MSKPNKPTPPSVANGGVPAKACTTQPCTAADMAKNAEHKKRADETCKKSKIKQAEGDSCALMSTRSLMADAFPGKPVPSEADMMKIGKDAGTFRAPPGGWGTGDKGPILKSVGNI